MARIQVEGLKELRRELKQLEQDDVWAPRLRSAGLRAGELVVSEARRSAARPRPTLAGTTATMGQRALGSLRVLAAQTRVSVAGGGARAPEFAGWEWGSRGTFRQFPRMRRGGYNVYPALARTRDEVIDIYQREIGAITRDAFPD